MQNGKMMNVHLHLWLSALFTYDLRKPRKFSDVQGVILWLFC